MAPSSSMLAAVQRQNRGHWFNIFILAPKKPMSPDLDFIIFRAFLLNFENYGFTGNLAKPCPLF